MVCGVEEDGGKTLWRFFRCKSDKSKKLEQLKGKRGFLSRGGNTGITGEFFYSFFF